MVSDKSSPPSNDVTNTVHCGVNPRASTSCSGATGASSPCNALNSYGKLLSTMWRHRPSSCFGSLKRKNELSHALVEKWLPARRERTSENLPTTSVLVCAVSVLCPCLSLRASRCLRCASLCSSDCLAFTDTLALCACVLASTLRPKMSSGEILARPRRPTFQVHFGEKSTRRRDILLSTKGSLTEKHVSFRHRLDGHLVWIVITRSSARQTLRHACSFRDVTCMVCSDHTKSCQDLIQECAQQITDKLNATRVGQHTDHPRVQERPHVASPVERR